MATVMARQTSAGAAPGAYDRVFYTGIAGAMALTVFAGFGSNYYFRLVSGTPVTISGGAVTPTVHLHAVLFTSWVLLFLAQTMLIASRRVQIHKRLGYASLALAVGMVVVGFRTAVEAAARGASPPGVDALTFLVIPLFDLVMFTGFYTLAIVNRRNRETHKRLMLLAYVGIITASIARFPGMLAQGPLAFFGLSFLFVVAAMVYDRVSRGHIHRVYVWGAPAILISVPLRLVISGTPAWQSLARWLTQ